VLAARAAQLRAGYVVTSTFGVGADFDERLMASMARAGGGHFYFIERPQQIQDLLTSELGETLEVVARRAVVELELPAGVDAELMHDLRAEVGVNTVRIELDDLVSSQAVSFIVKLRFPLGDPANRATIRASMTSVDRQIHGRSEIAWTFADHGANDAQPRDRRVDRLVAEIYAERARRDAVERNRAGEFDGAARLLAATRDRILSYAGDDAALHQIAASLQEDRGIYSGVMDAMQLKQAHQLSVSALRMRTSEGKARRAPRQS
jgi:hypothetical protein